MQNSVPEFPKQVCKHKLLQLIDKRMKTHEGSAYIYSFVTVGEFIAFLIGWNLILEYAIGSASVSKGISNYVDAIVDNRISNVFLDIFPINVPYFGSYADFFALGIIVVITSESIVWFLLINQIY
jgi:amino acid transporter